MNNKDFSLLIIILSTLLMLCTKNVNETIGSNPSKRDYLIELIPIAPGDIDFVRHPDWRYGFDKVALNDPLYDGINNPGSEAHNPDSRDEIYVSVEENQTELVNVVINGTAAHFGYISFYATSSNPNIINIAPDNRVNLTENSTTTLTLAAGEIFNTHETVEIHIMGVSPAAREDIILRTLFVEVYKNRQVTINYYRIVDPTSPNTVPRYNHSEEEIRDIISEILRQAVVEPIFRATTNLEVQYDINHNGYLDIRFDNFFDLGEEYNAIFNRINELTPNDPGIVENCAYVEKLRGVWIISNEIPANSTNITLQLNNTSHIEELQDYLYIGNEKVNIVPGSITETTVQIQRITNYYPPNSLLWTNAVGGYNNGLISILQTIEIATNRRNHLIMLSGTIVHEISHGYLANLPDVNESNNVMHWQQGTENRYILRNREMQGTITGSYIVNIEEPPVRQWNSYH